MKKPKNLLSAVLPAEQLKAVRNDAGLTQAEAAGLVGYSLRGWQDAESGRNNLQPATQALFLLALDKHPEYHVKKIPKKRA